MGDISVWEPLANTGEPADDIRERSESSEKLLMSLQAAPDSLRV